MTKKYDRSKSGFYGKKHTEESKRKMSEGRKITWAVKNGTRRKVK